jgi:hypothetical protein
MNVVFDLGGVVVAWKPDDIVARAFADPDDRVLAKREIIGHPDWLALDRGTMSYDEAIARGAKRTRLPEGAVRSLVESVAQSLVADPQTVDLLQRVKAGGNLLRASDTVFVDDTAANLEAAARFGIRTIHFQNAVLCESELRRTGGAAMRIV